MVVDYLYHYTDLKALKLILKNKTFRLSSLNRMDDLEEGNTTDFQKLGRFFYVSSWTSKSLDHPSFWRYINREDGIRIKMKSDIFKTQKIKDDIEIQGNVVEINDEFNIGIIERMKSENITFLSKVKLIKVNYTDSEELLSPHVYQKTSLDTFSLETKKLVFTREVNGKSKKNGDIFYNQCQ